jgi:hypothetical protein
VLFGFAKLAASVMNERLIDIRTELAASPRTRVEVGQDGVLHVLAGPVTLHLERAVCEELTTTLARAMVALAHRKSQRPPELRVVRHASPGEEEAPASERQPPRAPRTLE